MKYLNIKYNYDKQFVEKFEVQSIQNGGITLHDTNVFYFEITKICFHHEIMFLWSKDSIYILFNNSLKYHRIIDLSQYIEIETQYIFLLFNIFLKIKLGMK